MKKTTIFCAIVIAPILLLLFSSCLTARKIERSVKYIQANEAFSTVYSATREAILKANIKDYELENIEIKLGATSTKKGELGGKIWIVSGKYSRTFAKAKSATFTFADLTKADKSSDDLKLSKDFIDHVYNVLIAAKDIKPIENFGLSEFVAEVEFTITSSGEVGAEIELSPITPSLGFSKESEYVHSVSIKFKKVTPKK